MRAREHNRSCIQDALHMYLLRSHFWFAARTAVLFVLCCIVGSDKPFADDLLASEIQNCAKGTGGRPPEDIRYHILCFVSLAERNLSASCGQVAGRGRRYILGILFIVLTILKSSRLVTSPQVISRIFCRRRLQQQRQRTNAQPQSQ